MGLTDCKRWKDMINYLNNPPNENRSRKDEIREIAREIAIDLVSEVSQQIMERIIADKIPELVDKAIQERIDRGLGG